ncbi:MAG: hypothetical protein KC492_46025, partial [Myxococcales bacterium]|nr:hypothetical protein [Myxococcales bacterium]
VAAEMAERAVDFARHHVAELLGFSSLHVRMDLSTGAPFARRFPTQFGHGWKLDRTDGGRGF